MYKLPPYCTVFEMDGNQIRSDQSLSYKPYDAIRADMAKVTADVNEANITYGAITTNSNAFTHMALDRMGFGIGVLTMNFPGYNTDLHVGA
jgi:hypothetical protein